MAPSNPGAVLKTGPLDPITVINVDKKTPSIACRRGDGKAYQRTVSRTALSLFAHTREMKTFSLMPASQLFPHW
jgi:hypothetical protein